MSSVACVSTNVSPNGYYNCEEKVCETKENENSQVSSKPNIVRPQKVPWLDNIQWSQELLHVMEYRDLWPEGGLQVVNHFLPAYYPEGSAWLAFVSEQEIGMKIEDWGNYRDRDGAAIDLDSDKRADLFIYDYWHNKVVSSPRLPDFLHDFVHAPQCNPPPASNHDKICGSDVAQFSIAAFPFRGRMFPDSYGKITRLMMVADRLTADVIVEIMTLRPDIKFQILHPALKEAPKRRSPIEEGFLARAGFFLPEPLVQYELARNTFWPIASFFSLSRSAEVRYSPYEEKKCDWPPCLVDLWIRDQYYIGRNELGTTFAAHSYTDSIEKYIMPLTRAFGTVPIPTDAYEQGGQMLSSSKHFFIRYGLFDKPAFSPQENFVQMFANGLEIVAIKIPDRLFWDGIDLDEMITPLEEEVDGKPVVIVADGSDGFLSYWTSQGFNDVADQLRGRFHVDRIPYYHGYSYNNVLVERYEENGRLVKRVYMPWYNAWDNEKPANVYRKYGYTVIPIHGLEELVARNGSLHCVTKETERQFLGDWF